MNDHLPVLLLVFVHQALVDNFGYRALASFYRYREERNVSSQVSHAFDYSKAVKAVA